MNYFHKMFHHSYFTWFKYLTMFSFLHHQLWTHWAYSYVNLCYASGFFLYTLKTENQRFTDVFRRSRKRPVTWNGSMWCFYCWAWIWICFLVVIRVTPPFLKLKIILQVKKYAFFNPLTTVLIRNRNMVTFCWGSEMSEPSLIHFEDLFSLKFNAQNSIQNVKKNY